MVKEKLLVSACFVSDGYKYDGTNNINDEILKLQDKYEFVLVCPEVYGGLNTPRKPSEGLNGKVFMNDGTDVTEEFKKGALKSLEKALNNGVKRALLKAKSPSCGYGKIYDGSFSHTVVDGNGVFVQLLLENNILVYTEEDISSL